MERDCGDNYNVATVVPFYELDEVDFDKAMEPDFAAVESSFLRVADTIDLNIVNGMATCSLCNSCINLEAFSKKRSRDDIGVCPICVVSDDVQHIPGPKVDYSISEYDRGYERSYKAQCERNNKLHAEHDATRNRLNSMLSKIGKRPNIEKAAQKRMFDSLKTRSLLKQPAHSNALMEFKNVVATLLTRQTEVQAQQPKDIVNYLVATSWLSSHDEWQDKSDMDSY